MSSNNSNESSYDIDQNAKAGQKKSPKRQCHPLDIALLVMLVIFLTAVAFPLGFFLPFYFVGAVLGHPSGIVTTLAPTTIAVNSSGLPSTLAPITGLSNTSLGLITTMSSLSTTTTHTTVVTFTSTTTTEKPTISSTTISPSTTTTTQEVTTTIESSTAKPVITTTIPLPSTLAIGDECVAELSPVEISTSFKLSTGYQYVVYSGQASYSRAEDTCWSRGGFLLSIEIPEEDEAIERSVNSGNFGFFYGVNQTNRMLWTSGIINDASQLLWNERSADSEDPQLIQQVKYYRFCDQDYEAKVNRSAGPIRVLLDFRGPSSCWAVYDQNGLAQQGNNMMYDFVCKIPTRIGSDVTDPVQLVTDIKGENYEYFFYSKRWSYPVAVEICRQKHNATLLGVDMEEDIINAVVFKYKEELFGTQNDEQAFWTGAYVNLRPANRFFQWPEGKKSELKFYNGPNNFCSSPTDLDLDVHRMAASIRSSDGNTTKPEYCSRRCWVHVIKSFAGLQSGSNTTTLRGCWLLKETYQNPEGDDANKYNAVCQKEIA